MKKHRYHFIGIGGASMSSLAFYLHSCKNYVQGSDLAMSENIANLQKNNIKVFLNHKSANIKNVDVVVYNCAISENNAELMFAKNNNIKILSRAQLLYEISKKYKKVISVSGMHGKTTATAMLQSCFKYANKKPTIHIGANLKNYDFGFIKGKKKYFITEACEYKDSFLSLKSDIAVILNVEKEHLDYFKNIENIKKSFQKFAHCSKKVVCYHKFNTNNKNTIYYGDKNSGIYATNIVLENLKYSFDVFYKHKLLSRFTLNSFAEHNIKNALAVIVVCLICKIKIKFIKQGLENFKNANRRFEVWKNKNSLIIHDYAHHPTEIVKSIDAVKNVCKNKKLVVVFQPHTYSRTKTLFKNFLTCFENADEVVFFKTYAAREKFDKNSSAYALYKNLKQTKKCKYFSDQDACVSYLQKYFNNNFCVLILGAGDIDMIYNKI